MARVLIRNLDEKVLAAFRLKAELHNRSLEQEIKEVLSAAARFTPAERVTLAQRVRSMTPKNVNQTDSAELVRRDRDAR